MITNKKGIKYKVLDLIQHYHFHKKLSSTNLIRKNMNLFAH